MAANHQLKTAYPEQLNKHAQHALPAATAGQPNATRSSAAGVVVMR